MNELIDAKIKVEDAERKVWVNKGYLLALEIFEVTQRKKMSDELLSELRETIASQKHHNEKLQAEWQQRLKELSEFDWDAS